MAGNYEQLVRSAQENLLKDVNRLTIVTDPTNDSDAVFIMFIIWSLIFIHCSLATNPKLSTFVLFVLFKNKDYLYYVIVSIVCDKADKFLLCCVNVQGCQKTDTQFYFWDNFANSQIQHRL